MNTHDIIAIKKKAEACPTISPLCRVYMIKQEVNLSPSKQNWIEIFFPFLLELIIIPNLHMLDEIYKNYIYFIKHHKCLCTYFQDILKE